MIPIPTAKFRACGDCPRSTIVHGVPVCASAPVESQAIRFYDHSWVCPEARWPTPMRGVGDAVKRITGALGIPHCLGCAKRQELLNRLLPFGPKGSGPAPPPVAEGVTRPG